MQGIFHKKELIISNYFVIFLKNKMFLTEKDGIINLCIIFMYSRFLFYASNEPKSVLARDLGDCLDNLRNSRSVFLIVLIGVKIGYPICTEG